MFEDLLWPYQRFFWGGRTDNSGTLTEAPLLYKDKECLFQENKQVHGR